MLQQQESGSSTRKRREVDSTMNRLLSLASLHALYPQLVQKWGSFKLKCEPIGRIDDRCGKGPRGAER